MPTAPKRTPVKWIMQTPRLFTAEHHGYKLTVVGGYPWVWAIEEGSDLLDSAYRHNPTYNELAAKVQCEMYLTAIIN